MVVVEIDKASRGGMKRLICWDCIEVMGGDGGE